MGRQRRDLTQSEWYHVYNRGADRQDIFSNDGDHVLFEQLTAESFARFGLMLHAYVLMTNHFHLLAHCPRGGLSEAMQRLCGRYGSAYNERTRREGSVFTGRFKVVPITSDAQMAQVGRYIHRNPLAIVPAEALAAYRWSSLGCVLGRRPTPPWLASDELLHGFPTTDDYLSYVLTPQPADRVGEQARPPLTPTTCEEIDCAVHTVVDHRSPDREVEELRRTLAITLAIETRAADPAFLARRYGLSDPSSVRRIARRGRVRLAESETFASLRVSALQHLVRSD